jgi:predicted Zn finger-like uncharacterized protein
MIVYTQCPKCETVFKLSAEVLRAAAGQVRCGRCGEVFSALARLSEDASAFMDTESTLELETRADSILESAAALKVAEAVAKEYEDFVPPGIEIARLQVLDYWDDDDREAGYPGTDPSEAGEADTQPSDAADPAEPSDAMEDDAPSDAEAGLSPFGAAPLGSAGWLDPAQSSTAAADAPHESLDADLSDTDATGEREIPVGAFGLGTLIDIGVPEEEPTLPDPADHDAAPGPEGTQPDEGLDDASLEFTLPPGDLDRIFIESRPHGIPRAVAQAALDMAAQTASTADAQTHAAAPTTPPSTSTPPSTPPSASASAALPPPVARDTATPAAGTTAPVEIPASATEVEIPSTDAAEAAMATAELPLHPERAAMQAAGAHDRRARRTMGFEVPESVRRDLLKGIGSEPMPEPGLPQMEELRGPPLARGPLFGWLAAAAVLALLLGAQMLRRNAESFAEQSPGPLGTVLRSLSGAMGTEIPPPVNLSAYQVRQWGVSGDPAANGTLRLRASILNGAAQLQPYPLLRVTLADRFGKRIGTRDFQPAEYLGKAVARLMAPGERADAVLDILDPGKNAEGFEIDVCLRRGTRTLCANDAAPRTKP